MNKLLLFLLALLVWTGCPRDNRESLFEITYEPVEFTFPAGIPSFQTFVVARPTISSRFDQSLANNNVNRDQVDEVSGLFARITALSGEDFSQLRRVDLRICPADQTSGCTQFDVLFSRDDLFGRRQQTVGLNPSLRNFTELVESGAFRFELVLAPGETTNRNIDCRLEWGIRAVGRD